MNNTDLILEKLGEVFNGYTELIKENSIDYILEYGKYYAWKSLFGNICTGMFLATVFILIFMIFYYFIFELENDELFLKITIPTSLIIVFAYGFYEIILYHLSPLAYSLEIASKML